MTRRLAGLMLVSAAGFALGRAWPVESPPERASEASDDVVGPASRLPCPEAAPRSREVDHLRRELAQLEAEFLRGQLYDAETIGLPIAWPEDLDELWREESVERLLLGALGEQGELFALDCSEYPCIAVTTPLAGSSDFESARLHAEAVRARLEAAGLEVWVEQGVVALDDGGRLLVERLAFVAPDHPFPDRRKNFRHAELLESAQPAITTLANPRQVP